jgi:YbbR domain-containing protein
VKLKGIITNNLHLKILAFLIAGLLWLVVGNIEDPVTTKQFSDVPVEIINESVLDSINKVYEIKDGKTATFIVKGRESVLNSLTADDFLVQADLAHLSEVNAMNVDITPKSAGSNIEIYRNSNTVTVSIEDEASSNFPVTVVTDGTVKEGYAIGERVATPNLVQVTGPASLIKKIKTVQAMVNVDNAYKDVENKVELIYLNGDGDLLDADRLTADYDSVNVTVRVYKSKNIAVNVETIGELPDGYSVKNITYEPQTITVAASDEVLSSLTSITIDDVDISDIHSSKQYTIDPAGYIPEGVYLANTDEQIAVTVEVGKYITKTLTLTNDDIDISGGSPKYNYKLDPETTVKLIISGYQDDINKLKASDFAPMIDVSDRGVGSHLLDLQYSNVDNAEVTVSGKISVTVVKSN